ncbi:MULTISPECIES: GvpL/GvpF family gas vesicle protein [Rhodococcus]|uniref:Gas vesicle synthesis protein n=1 Tax=Rhodococcus opacus RKJ300 = JCM 13270 TaxID=1165867 RepID=I0WLR3_RHOOP|nr:MULTISPECIES: GvpL/GvpF family gas vesicle protein [Rhodococcus]EID77329.1 gas vesicle synthesis protein [Rhodococcus opacus RKJ300 = JCM 13270]
MVVEVLTSSLTPSMCVNPRTRRGRASRGPDRWDELEQTVGELARDWDGRIEMRLLGPLAAYDFAGTQKPEQS